MLNRAYKPPLGRSCKRCGDFVPLDRGRMEGDDFVCLPCGDQPFPAGRAAIVLALVALVAGCSPMVYTHGVPNLSAVGPNVYRSGQITTDEGWQWIASIAGKRHVHVLKLNYDTEGSDDGAVRIGFDVHVVAMEPRGDQDVFDDLLSVFKGPDPNLADIAQKLLESAGPDDLWLVHCTHGQDRTGFVVGRYRVLHDGWTKDRAYEEMLAHHFHAELHGVHEAWEQFTPPAAE